MTTLYLKQENTRETLEQIWDIPDSEIGHEGQYGEQVNPTENFYSEPIRRSADDEEEPAYDYEVRLNSTV